jgi:hypothetical protein
MKTFGITALLGVLVALPFILGQRKPQIVPITVKEKPRLETDLRYDIEDFLTE